MAYLLPALLIGLGSIWINVIWAAIFNRDFFQEVSFFVANIVCSIIYSIVLYYIFWLGSAAFAGPLPYFAEFFWGFLISAIIVVWFESDLDRTPASVVAIVVCLFPLVVMTFVSIANSDFYRANDYSRLVGKVEQIQYSSIDDVMKPIDRLKMNAVSYDVAMDKAHIALSKMEVDSGVTPGSAYKIDNGKKQFIDGGMYWVFPVDFNNWLVAGNLKEVPGYIIVSAENILENAKVIQSDKKGNKIHEIYTEEAAFDNQALRYLRYNGYMNSIISKMEFIIDDDMKPYYVASVYQTTIGYSGLVLKGIVTLDTQNGKIKYYDKDEQPDWTKTSVSLEVLNENVKFWGLYYQTQDAWSVFWNKDKSRQVNYSISGYFWSLVYDEVGNAQYFATLTSYNDNDESIVGFILCNAKTGEVKYYARSGFTQDIAIKTARSHWSNFKDYEPSNDVMIYNIYGKLTYYIPIEANNQFKGISLISVDDQYINSKGNSIEEALSAYRSSILKKDNSSSVDISKDSSMKEISGIIERIGFVNNANQMQFYNFKLKGVKKSFQISCSEANPEIIYMKEGDNVSVRYIDTDSKIETCQDFDIIGLDLN